jgi:hypothetical protein
LSIKDWSNTVEAIMNLAFNLSVIGVENFWWPPELPLSATRLLFNQHCHDHS